MIFLSKDSHAAILLGAKEKAEISNPKTWGNKAVIVDPWNKFVLPARDAMDYYNQSCEAWNVTNTPSVMKQLLRKICGIKKTD